MQLSVMLMLALPALCSAGTNSCEKDDEPVLLLDPSLEDRVPNITDNGTPTQALPTHLSVGQSLDCDSSFNIGQTNLEWQTFNGFLPHGSISIYNGYVGRNDYVCQFLSRAGFYNPDMDATPYCHYSSGGKEYLGSPFQILVNKDDFEFMEWKEATYGSVPQNSVNTVANNVVYVGKNKYGLGKVDTKNKAFFLPWKGSEYWYNYYQVLTFSKDVYSEHISEVKYETDGVKPIAIPPETMRKSAITNKGCQTVTGTAALSKTYQVEQRWDTSFSITAGVQTSITAEIPIIGSATIGFSIETTLQFTMGTTYIESTTHTVSVQHIIPPNESCVVSMVGFEYRAEIPYTARLSRTYSNGKTSWTSITGTYKGVQMGEVMGVVDR
uniref:Natterin-3-like n=2 Tax=Cyclopterus lumpus TaxID=8103 RepID=A0A8C2Z2Q2_CYCLU